MSSITAHVNLKPTTTVLFAPLLFLALLFWNTRRATILWSDMASGYYPAYPVLFFGGFVALIAAFHAHGVPLPNGRLRMRFVALALVYLGALSWLGSLAASGLLSDESSIALFVWSHYLGLPLGALFGGLAVVRWSKAFEAVWLRLGWWLFVGATGLGVLFFGVITAVPHPFITLVHAPAFPFMHVGLATAAIAVYLWAARRAWNEFRLEGTLFGQRLALALLLLASTQFSLALARPGDFFWPLHYGLFLSALLASIWAILSTLRANNTLQVPRYFALTGSVSISGLSLLVAELFVLLFDLPERRLLIMATMLAQGAVNFLLLYAIVVYLNRLIEKRTIAYQREQRLRNDLTQMIVHDLKSPLTVIHSSIGLLLKGHLGNLEPHQTRVLQRANQANKHILKMIETLLDVERLEAGATALQRQEIQSTPWLRTCLSNWEMVAEARDTTIQVAICENLPVIWGDPELLQRVLDNLLSNALNFTPEGESVEVTAFSQDNQMIIQVADRGPGVPESERQRIFEKFARVEGVQRRGSGLGLTFCRMVAEAHQGCIAVTDNPTGGAIFTVSLPLPIPNTPPDAVIATSLPHLLISGR